LDPRAAGPQLYPTLHPSNSDSPAPIDRPRRPRRETWRPPGFAPPANPDRARWVQPGAATVRESAARKREPERLLAALPMHLVDLAPTASTVRSCTGARSTVRMPNSA